MKTFALALGSGGARGLAHIAVIEALDEMGVKPVAIAGTSIGALIGAAYAAGMSGKDIRHHVIGVRPRPARNHDAASCRRAPASSRDLLLRRVQPGDADGRREILRPVFAGRDAGRIFRARNSADGDGDRSASASRKRHCRPDRCVRRSPPRSPFPACSGRCRWTAASWSTAAPPIRCRSIGSPAAPMSSSPSTYSACRRRSAATCRAPGKACSRRSSSWARPSSPPSTSTRRPISVIRPNVGIFRTLDFYQASSIIRAAEAAKAEMKEKLGALLAVTRVKTRHFDFAGSAAP